MAHQAPSRADFGAALVPGDDRRRPGVPGPRHRQRLLEAILMKADEKRLPCYLETHGEKSARLYERHGFETVRLFAVPRHAIPVWAMLRPQSGS